MVDKPPQESKRVRSFLPSKIVSLPVIISVAALIGIVLLMAYCPFGAQPEDELIPLTNNDNDILVLTEEITLIDDLIFYDWMLTNEIGPKK